MLHTAVGHPHPFPPPFQWCSILAVASGLLAVPALAQPDSGQGKGGWRTLRGEFLSHRSLNHMERVLVTIHRGGESFSAFGTFGMEEKTAMTGYGSKTESACWLEAGGRRYKPEETDSISVNGIPGKPAKAEWWFTREGGILSALSRTPFGEIDRVAMEGKEYRALEAMDNKEFRARLKTVPEAVALWPRDRLGAVRYFNQAADGERVADIGYDHSFKGLEDPRHAYTGKAYRERLARNGNDLVALGMEAEYLCAKKKAAGAAANLDRMDAIKPGHVRTITARAFCLEKAGRWLEANRLHDSSLHLIRRARIPEVRATMEENAERHAYDSDYSDDAQRRWTWELEMGVGLPHAMAGAGLSLHRKLGSWKAAVLASYGSLNLVHREPSPVLGLRFYTPGRNLRGFAGGYGFNLFRSADGDAYRSFGPDLGVVIDDGDAYAWKWSFAAAYYFISGHRVDGKRKAPRNLPFLHGSLSYEF